MGIIRRGILGGFSNKVANVVGTSWKGRAVIKSLPLSVANPRTTPQVNQRTKFGDASKFFSVILGLWVKPLWDRFAGDISGYNAIMKLNVELFSNTGEPIWNSLLMSKGRMEVPSISSLVADVSDGVVTATVDAPNDTTWGQSGQTVFVAFYNQTTGVFLGVGTGIVDPAIAGDVSVYSDDFVAGNTIRAYAAIKRADGTQVSNSATSTAVAVA